MSSVHRFALHRARGDDVCLPRKLEGDRIFADYFFPAGLGWPIGGGAAPPFGFLFFSAFGFRFSLDGRIEPLAMTTPYRITGTTPVRAKLYDASRRLGMGADATLF